MNPDRFIEFISTMKVGILNKRINLSIAIRFTLWQVSSRQITQLQDGILPSPRSCYNYMYMYIISHTIKQSDPLSLFRIRAIPQYTTSYRSSTQTLLKHTLSNETLCIKLCLVQQSISNHIPQETHVDQVKLLKNRILGIQY